MFWRAAALLLCATTAIAQDAPPPSSWTFNARVEVRANYRDSNDSRFRLGFPFPPSFLPVGQTAGFEQTVDPGSHVELSVAQIRLDAAYGKYLAGHVLFHAWDKYRRNPTTSERRTDFDELWIRLGSDRLFAQIGKAPKMERQPVRLLESYGLAATAFNRMEDTQLVAGGTIVSGVYWRLQLADGNPLFFRDPNALAGDNGTPDLNPFVHPNPDPRIKSGFPILYNAETQTLTFNSDHTQFGQGLGYRWQRADQNAMVDAIAFHYRRTMSAAEKALDGTFYGPDLDLLLGPADAGLPLHGNEKVETGARAYGEWYGFTGIAQFTKQSIAGLHRSGIEIESGYRIAVPFGPVLSVQPAVRWSELTNKFKGDPKLYPAPSVWWNWKKIDAGVRIGFAHGVDVTIEHAFHSVSSARPVDPDETLVTLRVRV